MADSKFSKENVKDEVPGYQTFEVSGKRLEKVCQPCCNAGNRTVADDWCLDCYEYLCSSCSKTHLQFTISKDHKIVAASDAAKSSVSYDMGGIDQCKEHNKKLEFVCEDHIILCCGICVIAKHRKCRNVVEIESKTKANVTDLTSIRRDLLDIESKVKAYAQRLINIREKVTTDATEITNNIQDMQDKVNEMFDNLKRNVAKEIHSFQQQAFQDLDVKNDVCISYTAKVTEALSDVDNVRQQGTPSQQFIVAHHLKDRVKTLQMKIDNDVTDLKDVNMSFDFDRSIQLPPTNNATPGKLTLKYVPADVTTCIDMTKSQQKDQKGKLTLHASICLKQRKFDEKEPLYPGLDFLADGRVVAVDNFNRKCLVYDQKLEKVGSVLLPDESYDAHDVTVMTDESVAVSSGSDTSSGSRIYFITISKTSKVKVTRTLKVTMNCDTICMMTDDHFLVGCYNDPQPVRIVSVEGKETPLAINFPSKQYKFDDKSCTYIKHRNKLVLSDRFANTVYIYDIANNTRVEVKDEKVIKEPRGMAVGPADCIFVCSHETNSIVQISHTGQILSSHVLDMAFPLSVCVSKDNTRLAVSNSCTLESKLQLFNIELI